MRNDWNEELRRAYDQGYWDARREFERHLEHDHRGQSRGGDLRGSESRGSESRGSELRGGGREERSGSYESGSRLGGSQSGTPQYRSMEERGGSGRESRGGASFDIGRYEPEYRGQGMRSSGTGSSNMGHDVRNGRSTGSSGIGRESDRNMQGRQGDYPLGNRGGNLGRDDRSRDREEGRYRNFGWEDRSREDRNREDRDDRNFLERAGDEVRSWFGDDDDDRRNRDRDRDRDRDRGDRNIGESRWW